MVQIIEQKQDTGTGKYKTASERGEDRTLSAPVSEPAGKVSARSEEGETTLESSTDVGPRRKVETTEEVTYGVEEREATADEDKKVRRASTKTRTTRRKK